MNPTAFNLASNLYIKDVIGIRQAVEKVQSAFRSASVDVNLRVASASLRNLDELNAKVAVLRKNLNDAQGAAGAGQLSSIGRGSAANLNTLRQSLGGVGATLKSVNATAAEGVNAFEKYGEATGLAARRFLAFSIGAGAIAKFVQGIRSGIGEALEFERSMIKLSQVSGDTPDKIQGVKDEIVRLSTTMGVASKELADVSVTLRQAGLSAKETQEALQPISMASLAANFGSMKEITEGVIAVMRQFKIESGQLGEALGAMNVVAAGFAVEGKDLIVVAQKAGGAFAATGGSLNELLGIFTAVRATTRESADTIASGLRTIFSRIQRNSTVEALKDLGINLRRTRLEAEQLGNLNLQDQFVGTFESFRRISEGLSSIRPTDPRYAAILNELGGDRQISKLIPAIREYATAQEAFNVAKAGEVSLQIAAAKAQDGTLVKLTKIREEYLGLFRTITDSSGFKHLAENLISVASGFAKMLDFAKPLLPVLATLAAVKLAEGLIGFGAKATASLTYAKPNPVVNSEASPRLRFNRGGIVPGVGDVDSVDTTLPPGSFVMSKRATQRLATGGTPVKLTPGEAVYSPEEARRIGYDKLQRLNRYATGGKTHNEHSLLMTGVKGGDNPLEQEVYRGRHAVGDRVQRPIRKMSQKELKTRGDHMLRAYTGDYHENINYYLRNKPVEGTTRDPQGLKEAASLLTTVVKDRGRLGGNLEPNQLLYRGINTTGLEAITKQLQVSPLDESSVGKVILDKGFISTSLSKGYATSRGPIVFVIKPNPKRHGSNIDADSSFGGEDEVLLQRGGRFKITGQDAIKKLVYVQQLAAGGKLSGHSRLAAANEQRGLRPRTPDEQRGFAPSPNKQGMLLSHLSTRLALGDRLRKTGLPHKPLRGTEGLDDEADFAVQSYAGSLDSFNINKFLRTGELPVVNPHTGDDDERTDQYFKRRAALMTYGLKKRGRLGEHLTPKQKLTRGVKDDALAAISEQLGSNIYEQDAVGKTFVDKGFVSTTTRHKPKTTKHAYNHRFVITPNLDRHGSPLNDLRNEDEKEVLLQRGSRFKILSQDEKAKTIHLQQLAAGGKGVAPPRTPNEREVNRGRFAAGGLQSVIIDKQGQARHVATKKLSGQEAEAAPTIHRLRRAGEEPETPSIHSLLIDAASQAGQIKSVAIANQMAVAGVEPENKKVSGDVVRKKLAVGTIDGPLLPDIEVFKKKGLVKKDTDKAWSIGNKSLLGVGFDENEAYQSMVDSLSIGLITAKEIYDSLGLPTPTQLKPKVPKTTKIDIGVNKSANVIKGASANVIKGASVNAIRSIAETIHETVPNDNPFVLLGRDLWPAVPVLREVHKRDAQYFVWSRPQINDRATAQTWQKEVHPNSFVFDTGFAGSIFNAIRGRYNPTAGDKQIDPAKMLLFSSIGDYSEVGSHKNLSRQSIVANIEHLEKLNPRGASYSPVGGLIYTRGDDEDSGKRKHTVPEVLQANHQMLLELGLSEDAAKRYAKFTGGTPQERLGLPNKEQLAEHYARVARARGKFAAGGATLSPDEQGMLLSRAEGLATGGPLRGREPGSLKKILSAGMLGLSMYVGGVQSEDAAEVLQRQRVDNVKDRDEAERQAAGKQRKIKKATGGRLGVAAGGRPDDLEPVIFDRQGQARRVDVKKPAGLDAEHLRLQRAQIEKPGSQEAGNTQYIHSLLMKPPVAAGVGGIKSLAVERQVRSANKRATGGDVSSDFLQAFQARKLKYASAKDFNISTNKPKIDPDEVIRLAGIPEDFGGSLKIHGDDAIIHAASLGTGLPKNAARIVRDLQKRKDRIFVDNDSLEIDQAHQGRGLATGVYARQLAHGLSSKLPVHYKIRAGATDDGKSPGYLIWPMAFGVPGELNPFMATEFDSEHGHTLAGKDAELFDKFRDFAFDRKDIQDLLKQPWGREAWTKFGREFTSVFPANNASVLGKLTEKLRSPKAVFATGDLVKLPRSQRLSLKDALSNIQERPDLAGGATSQNAGRPYAKELARLALEGTGALKFIPKGSQFLGSGIVGLAYKTPQGDVIRVQPTGQAALDQARKAKPDIDEVFLSPRRLPDPDILQPTSSKLLKNKKADISVERLPFVQNVRSREEALAASQILETSLASRNLHFADQGFGNVGKVGDRYVVRDPGSVLTGEEYATYTERKKQRSLERNQLAIQRHLSKTVTSPTPIDVQNDAPTLLGRVRQESLDTPTLKQKTRVARLAGGGAPRPTYEQRGFHPRTPDGQGVFMDVSGKLGREESRKRYATGGTVNRSGLIPGSGDTDSVPLDLPAGSFVIRKSSVKSIGPKKLAELSSGGDSPADGATVPALLMPQEWVFNPQDTARIGAATLHRMNTMGRLPFRSGGLVGGRIGFASGNKVESAEVKLTDISKEDNPQIYTDVESSVKKLSGSLAKVVKSVEDVGTVMVRFSDSGPVFERVVKSTAELNKVIEEEAKKQKQAAPAKKDSVLSSLSPAQAKVYMQHEPKIERAIGKAANGADPSGGLYDAGSTALAYAIKGHKQKQLEAGEKVSYKDFKPYSYIERAISQKAGRLADGKAGKTESTDPTILNESHSARYAEELAEPLPTTEHGFEDILASNKTTYRKAQDAAKRAGVSAKGSQSDILDRLAESQAPKHLQQPQQAVTNRESAVSRLKALGVDVQGGISSPLSDDVLSGLVPVAERVPANIRTLLESAGNRVTVSPDKLKSIPAFRNVKLSDDSVDGASLPTGSAISGFAAFTDSRGYGRPDSELYGRATLLHERGHDVDKAIGGVFRKKGLIKEERFSSTPEYLALHEATAKAVLPGIKDETGRKRLLADPKESFAEGFNRYVYDDKQRASLPADTQKYFSGLVARADKLVEQPTAVGTKAQLGPLEEAGKFARTTPVPTRNYNISRGAAYFGQENEQYQSSPLIARKGYQSYFGKEKKPVIATDIRSLLATEKLAGVNRSPAEVLRRQSANETVLSAAEMQNLLGDSPAAVATNATVAATKVSPASQVPAHSLPARPVALQPGSQTATPITSPAHSPTAGAANLPTTGGANQSAASATKIPVHALPTRPAALQTRVLPPGAATIPLSPQNQATASPAANNARQGVVPLAASAPTQTTTASGGQPPAPPKPKAPGAAGDEEPEKKQRKAKLPEDVSGIFRSLVQEITSLVGAIKKVRGDLTTSGDEGSARRPRKTGQAGADDFESGGIGRNKLLDSLGVKRQSPAAFASGLPGNGLPESGLASSGLGSNKLLDSLAGPPLPDTTAEKAKAKKQVEIAKAEAKQRKDEEKTRQAAQAVLSAKTITPPAKSLQVVDDSQRIDSLRASIIERHENRPAVSAKGWPDGMSSTSTNGWPGGKLPGWDSLSASAGKWPGGMLPPPAATAKQWPGGMLPEPAMSANVWADGMLPAQGMSVRGWPGGRLPTWASLSASSATANVWPGSMSPTSTSSPTPAVSAQRWPIAMRSAFAFDVPDANGLVQDKNRGLVDIATTNKTRDRIQARGGENVLSQQSQQAIKARALYEEETRVAREFISAERKAVQALHPTIRAYEAQKIAVENYNQKIAEGKEKIVRDDKGRILGSESTVRALEAKGQVAPGAGIVARGTNAVSSFYSNVSDRAAAIGERARGLPGVSGAGKLFSGLRNYAEKFQGSGIGSGALFALPLLTGQFEQHIGGTADSAVTRGETGKGYLPDGRYSTGKALSGSVQGAASYGIGAAAIGSVIPGVGSAVAGIIGGSFGVVKGFVDALHEAEKELRDVKLAKALNDFAQNLSAYAQAGNQANPAAVSLLSTSLADTRKLGDDEARKESSGLFTSFDYQKFATLRQSNLRKRLGQSLPDITQSLNRQVEEAAHRSPNDRPANITSRVFGGGVNLDLLRTISEVRNVSLKQATDEFKKVIEQAQKSRRVEDAGQAARVGEERNVSTFGRFLASIQSASDSLVKLQTNAQALSTVFGSSLEPSRVSFGAERLNNLGLGRGDTGVFETLGLIRNVGNAAGSDQGARLFQAGSVATQLSQILPGILANAAAANPTDEESFGTRVRNELTRVVGGDQAVRQNQQLGYAINTVISSLNNMTRSGGLDQIYRSLQVDSTRLSSQLLSSYSDPLREYGQNIARLLEERSNAFINSLTQLTERTRAVGETYDRLAQAQVGTVRASADIQDVRSLASPGSSALRLPLQQLQFAGQYQQERLTGFQGQAANDPVAIGRALRRVQDDIQTAAQRQREIALETGGQGPRYEQAAQSLLNLQTRAQNLGRALSTLADSTTRNSLIQERLSVISRERSARTSYASRFLQSSPEEQVSLNRGVGLLMNANQRGNLSGFTQDQVRSILETAQGHFGSVRLPALGNETGETIANRLIAATPGYGGFIQGNPQQANEERQLQDQLISNMQTAERALEQSATAQQTNIQFLVSNLHEQQTTFFANLRQYLTEDRVNRLQVRQGELGEQTGRLQRLGGQATLLGRVGITDDRRLTTARGAEQSFRTFFDTQQRITDAGRISDTAPEAAVGLGNYLGVRRPQELRQFVRGGDAENVTQGISSFLTGNPSLSGLTPSQQTNIISRTQRLAVNAPNRGEAGQGNTESTQVRSFVDFLRPLLLQSIRTELGGGQGTALADDFRRRGEAQGTLNRLGFSTDGLQGIVQSGQSQRFLESLTAFDNAANQLSTLPVRLQQINQQFAEVAEEIGRVRVELNRGAAPRAAGGVIERYHTGGVVSGRLGRREVPIIAEQNEMVVNRTSTKANMPLLQAINDAKGPLALSRGGVAQYLEVGGAAQPSLLRRFGRGLLNVIHPRNGQAVASWVANRATGNNPLPASNNSGVGRLELNVASVDDALNQRNLANAFQRPATDAPFTNAVGQVARDRTANLSHNALQAYTRSISSGASREASLALAEHLNQLPAETQRSYIRATARGVASQEALQLATQQASQIARSNLLVGRPPGTIPTTTPTIPVPTRPVVPPTPTPGVAAAQVNVSTAPNATTPPVVNSVPRTATTPPPATTVTEPFASTPAARSTVRPTGTVVFEAPPVGPAPPGSIEAFAEAEARAFRARPNEVAGRASTFPESTAPRMGSRTAPAPAVSPSSGGFLNNLRNLNVRNLVGSGLQTTSRLLTSAAQGFVIGEAIRQPFIQAGNLSTPQATRELLGGQQGGFTGFNPISDTFAQSDNVAVRAASYLTPVVEAPLLGAADAVQRIFTGRANIDDNAQARVLQRQELASADFAAQQRLERLNDYVTRRIPEFIAEKRQALDATGYATAPPQDYPAWESRLGLLAREWFHPTAPFEYNTPEGPRPTLDQGLTQIRRVSGFEDVPAMARAANVLHLMYGEYRGFADALRWADTTESVTPEVSAVRSRLAQPRQFFFNPNAESQIAAVERQFNEFRGRQIDERDAATDYRWLFRGDINVGGFPASTRRTLESVGMQRLAEIGLRLEASEARETEASATDEQRSFILRLREEQANIILARLRGRGLAGNVIGAASQENPGWAGILRQYVAATPFHSLPEELRDHAGEAREQQQEQDDVNRERFWRNLWTTRMQPAEFEPARRLLDNQYLLGKVVPGGPEFRNRDRLDFPEEYFNYRGDPVAAEKLEIRQRQAHLLEQAGVINSTNPNHDLRVSEEEYAGSLSTVTRLANTFLEPRPLSLDEYLRAAGLPRLEEDADHQRLTRTLGPNSEGIRLGAEIRSEQRQRRIRELMEAAGKNKFTARRVQPEELELAVTRATGGPVYRSGGGHVGHSPIGFPAGERPDPAIFRPSGTDSVPARLEAGSFVVSRKGVQKNRGILQSLLQQPQAYDNGGLVNAMLTPGEIVAPPHVARGNMSLLQRINSGEAVYRSEGGSIGVVSPGSFGDALAGAVSSTLGASLSDITFPANAAAESGMKGEKGDIGKLPLDGSGDFKKIFSGHMVESTKLSERGSRDSHYLQKNFFSHLGGSQGKFFNDLHRLFTMGSRANVTDDSRGRSIHVLNTLAPRYFSAGGFVGGGQISAPVLFQPVKNDKVPAMLEVGEAVISRKQAQANRGLIDAINKGNGAVPFYVGGSVRQPRYYARGTSCVEPIYAALGEFIQPQPRVLGELREQGLFAQRQDRLRRNEEEQRQRREDERRRAQENIHGPQISQRERENRRLEIEFQEQLQQQTRERAAAEQAQYVQRFNRQSALDPLGISGGLAARDNAQNAFLRDANANINFAFVPQEQLRETARQRGEEALSRNYTLGSLSSLRQRQTLARTQNNPFAAFGRSRADSSTQASLQSGTVQQRQESRDQLYRTNFVANELTNRYQNNYQQQFVQFGMNRRAMGGPILRMEHGGAVPGELHEPEDSRLAYLSSNEYVFPRQAVQNIGVPALDRIRRFASGGYVGQAQPLAAGGIATSNQSGSGIDFSSFISQLGTAFGGFATTSSQLVLGFTQFNTSSASLAQALAAFPSKISMDSTHRHEVILNGTEALAGLQDALKAMVIGEVKKNIAKLFKDIPELNVSTNLE